MMPGLCTAMHGTPKARHPLRVHDEARAVAGVFDANAIYVLTTVLGRVQEGLQGRQLRHGVRCCAPMHTGSSLRLAPRLLGALHAAGRKGAQRARHLSAHTPSVRATGVPPTPPPLGSNSHTFVRGFSYNYITSGGSSTSMSLDPRGMHAK